MANRTTEKKLDSAVDTLKEISQRADNVLDGRQGGDVVALRKALRLIAFMASTEVNVDELPFKER